MQKLLNFNYEDLFLLIYFLDYNFEIYFKFLNIRCILKFILLFNFINPKCKQIGNCMRLIHLICVLLLLRCLPIIWRLKGHPIFRFLNFIFETDGLIKAYHILKMCWLYLFYHYLLQIYFQAFLKY